MRQLLNSRPLISFIEI